MLQRFRYAISGEEKENSTCNKAEASYSWILQVKVMHKNCNGTYKFYQVCISSVHKF